MMKKYLIPAIAAIIALAGCSKDVQEQRAQADDSGEVHSLSVEIESGAYGAVEGDTKASMEAVIRVKWKKDDEVSVVNATTGKLLGGCLKAEEDGESVVFTGSVTGSIAQGNSLYYIYPRVANNTEEVAFGSYDISLAAQTYDGKKIGDVCFYGYAQDQAGSAGNSISKKIKFTLVTSYAHLNMANLSARNTGLSRIDISNVNEGFTWKLTGGALSAAAFAGNNAISVRCGNADISKAGNAVARFAIPASAETATNRVVTVNNAYTNNNYVKSELKASAYYNQLYTTWTENVAQVNTDDPSKTKVTIDNNNSKDVAEGAIPTEAFGTTGQTSKPTEVSIGGMGTVTFDEDATARILGNADVAGATSVLLKVEDVTTTKPVEDADVVYEVTMKTLDENGTEVFPDAQGTDDAEKPGTATISINLDPDVMYVHTISLVKDDGTPIDGGVIPESIVLDLTNHILTFKVEHFSKYAVGYVKKDKFVAVTGVSLNKNALTLPVGDNETLVATVAPDNATNPKVKWTSSNTAVATVDKDGKVAAVAHGTATITVTTEDGSKTATCAVTVLETKTMAELLATNPDIPEVNDLTPPSNAWVNSLDSNCKAFTGIDGQEYKIFTAWKCIPGTEEDAIVNFGLLMEDVFVRTDENTYTHTEDIVTVIAKMTEGKLTSCEFIFDSSVIQWIVENDLEPADLAKVTILAGTYSAPAKVPNPIDTDEEEDIL